MESMVSVIIPVYKGEKTIERCVESLMQQTYSLFEIILIDDGSPDNSGIICDELAKKHSNIRVIHQENKGVSSARNVGIDNVTTKYFVCVDCDDIVKPNYLSDMILFQENNEEIGHVCCGFHSISLDKDFIYSNNERITIVDRKNYMDLYDKILVQSPCTRLYLTKIVKKNSIKMKKDISLGEDLIFNLEYLDFLKKTKIGIINSANYIYIDKNDNSLSRSFRRDLCEIYQRIDSQIKNYLLKWKVFDGITISQFYNNVYYHYMIVIENINSKNSTLNLYQRYIYNNHIMKNADFIDSLKYKSVKIPFLYEIAYKSRCYFFVVIVNLAYKFAIKIRLLCK